MRELPEHFALVLSRACSAACAHCGSSAGPDRRDWMDPDVATRAIDVAAAQGIAEVSLTGGEPLLDRALTLHCIAHAHAAGLRTVLCSNGFWARSPEAARRTVTHLRDAGLDRLQLSTDRWHLPFVPADAVVLAAEASRDAGLETQVAIPAGRGDWVAMELLTRFSALDGVDAFTHPAHPVGRGEHLPPAALQPLSPGVAGCTAAGHLEVDVDGGFSICPVSADFGSSSALRLGNVSREPLDALLDRYRRTPLFHLVSRHGPVALARLAGERAPTERHACHVCRRVHTDESVLAALIDALGFDPRIPVSPDEVAVLVAGVDQLVADLTATSVPLRGRR